MRIPNKSVLTMMRNPVERRLKNVRNFFINKQLTKRIVQSYSAKANPAPAFYIAYYNMVLLIYKLKNFWYLNPLPSTIECHEGEYSEKDWNSWIRPCMKYLLCNKHHDGTNQRKCKTIQCGYMSLIRIWSKEREKIWFRKIYWSTKEKSYGKCESLDNEIELKCLSKSKNGRKEKYDHNKSGSHPYKRLEPLIREFYGEDIPYYSTNRRENQEQRRDGIRLPKEIFGIIDSNLWRLDRYLPKARKSNHKYPISNKELFIQIQWKMKVTRASLCLSKK